MQFVHIFIQISFQLCSVLSNVSTAAKNIAHQSLNTEISISIATFTRMPPNQEVLLKHQCEQRHGVPRKKLDREI